MIEAPRSHISIKRPRSVWARCQIGAGWLGLIVGHVVLHGLELSRAVHHGKQAAPCPPLPTSSRSAFCPITDGAEWVRDFWTRYPARRGRKAPKASCSKWRGIMKQLALSTSRGVLLLSDAVVITTAEQKGGWTRSLCAYRCKQPRWRLSLHDPAFPVSFLRL